MQQSKHFVLHNMVQRFAEIVDRVTAGSTESLQDDDAVNAVAMLYHNKAHGMYRKPLVRTLNHISCSALLFHVV